MHGLKRKPSQERRVACTGPGSCPLHHLVSGSSCPLYSLSCLCVSPQFAQTSTSRALYEAPTQRHTRERLRPTRQLRKVGAIGLVRGTCFTAAGAVYFHVGLIAGYAKPLSHSVRGVSSISRFGSVCVGEDVPPIAGGHRDPLVAWLYLLLW